MPLPLNLGVSRALWPIPPRVVPLSAIFNTSGQPVFNTSGQGLTAV